MTSVDSQSVADGQSPAGSTRAVAPADGGLVKLESVTRDEWYELAAGFFDWGFRHSYDFNQRCAVQQSSRVEQVKATLGGRAIGLAAVRIKRLPMLSLGIAYIGGGPLTQLADGVEPSRLAMVLSALRQRYVEEQGLLLRVSPPLVAPELMELAQATYLSAGFEISPRVRGYRTMLLDLAADIPEIQARLAKRWKRQLNKGLKSGFELEVGTSDELFEQFCELFARFVKWKGFEVEHGPSFHLEVHKRLPEAARYLIVLCRHQGQLAGGLVLARTGDTAAYVLGATNPDLRDLRPGHYLQFKAIEKLKELGLRYYDLGGIDPEANPGVYEFKAGMTDVDISAPGPFECSPGIAQRLLLEAAELGYRKFLEFKRRS